MTRHVLVVGGGLAGWTAAVAAQEQGARVTLVERSAVAPGFGNSILSGGALHAVLGDPRGDPTGLAARIGAATEGHADAEVAKSWAGNARRALDWIVAHGGTLSADPAHAHRAAVFAPIKPTEPGLAWAGFGTADFLLMLRTRFLASGGMLVQPARAAGLTRGDRGWAVAIAGRAGSIAADAVVLADGGFQGDPELLRRYVGTDRLKLRAAETSTGDGLRMGLSAGADAVNMDGFYGHLLVRDALTRDDLWPYPILDVLAAVGVVVGRDGRRLVDESIGGVTTTNAVARSADPLGCWLIVDAIGWAREGRIGTTPPNPALEEAGVPPLSAPTLGELGRAAAIDPAGLVATGAALSDIRGAAKPPREGTLRLNQPPFRAIPLVAGITFTLGGLRVDGHARCLDAEGLPIAGLYAAGGTMGGLHGGPCQGYAGGLLEAAVFGLLAGEHAGRAHSQE